MSPPEDGPRRDDPVPKIVYRRKPETTPSSGIEEAREAMRRAAQQNPHPFPEDEPSIPVVRPPVPAPPEQPARPRNGLLWALVAINLVFCLISFLALRQVSAALTWEEASSWDLGADLDHAIVGLGIPRTLCLVAAGGFGIAALGLLTRSRLGWRAAILWAVVCTLTLAGAVYGLPSPVALRHPAVRGRFERPPA